MKTLKEIEFRDFIRQNVMLQDMARKFREKYPEIAEITRLFPILEELLNKVTEKESDDFLKSYLEDCKKAFRSANNKFTLYSIRTTEDMIEDFSRTLEENRYEN